MKRRIPEVALVILAPLILSCAKAPTPSPTPTQSPAQADMSSSNKATAAALKPTCSTPDFPEPLALGIDNQCGNQGNGGKEAAQNSVKNNFCPLNETPKEVTIADLQQLQEEVKKDSSIKFGPAGPTVDRAPLTKLGEGQLVTLKAFVLKAKQEKGESVNCKGSVPEEPVFDDIHIAFVDDAHKPQPNDSTPIRNGKECSGIVAEMSPHHRPAAWTEANLTKVATTGALVRITGQQFFDSSHVPCANGAPVGSNPKRVSLWEIHPIYKFEVCTANCTGAGQWQPLDQWVTQH